MHRTFDPRPVTLEGEVARLEPLGLVHAPGLFAVGADPRVWRYLPDPTPESLADVEGWIQAAVDCAGDTIPFAIVDRRTGEPIGSTRYLDIQPPHRKLEIGWTWLARSHWRTPVNTECKLLLLSHAFDDHHALRVQLKTDARNARSQRARARIGAVREGVLRNDVICHDGHQRDTVYFSITDDEWPGVKARLEGMLGGR